MSLPSCLLRAECGIPACRMERLGPAGRACSLKKMGLVKAHFLQAAVRIYPHPRGRLKGTSAGYGRPAPFT